jgi:hypothetical protein
MTGKDDKRQITVMITSTATGRLLPMQMIWEGKTKRCLTNDHSADIIHCHSESHWTTKDTAVEFARSILQPHLKQTIADTGLPESQRGLFVWDVYTVHTRADVIAEIKSCGYEVVFVPGNCTSKLQVADVAYNKPWNDRVRECFAE